ncbi:hypothetical protein [Compostibacter hankyongensis]
MQVFQHIRPPYLLRVALGSCICLLAALGARAQQQDSTIQQQTIDIYNVYQPELRNAAKLNLTTALPSIDTTRPRLVYNIPSQNLYFTYQPVPLRPLAMGKDSLEALQNNFIKAGFGNYSTPLLQVGLGSGRNNQYNYSLFFNHLSSKGSIEHQQFSNDNLHLRGQYFAGGHEFHANVGYDRNAVNYYGYDHDSLKLSRDDVRQAYNTFSVSFGLSNTEENRLTLNYQPELKLTSFADAHDQSEFTFYLKIPAQKKIVKDIFLVADFIGDFSNYRHQGDSSFSNSIVAFHPAVLISKPGFVLRAGINPTWTNNKFVLLPDIVNETHLIKNSLILSSGWISYFTKNSYQHLVSENPFLGDYSSPTNTRVEEKYTGIKGSINSHFNYNTKFAYVVYEDRPLYLNDTLMGNKFTTRYEEELKAYQLHAEIGYVQEEKFQARLSMNWFNYFKQKTEAKPWGLSPFRADLSFQYAIGEKFRLSADAFALSGSSWQDSALVDHKTKGAFDLNLGASYQIGKHFGVWANVNNLLGSHYQRWHNYPSLGLNALGGILFKF